VFYRYAKDLNPSFERRSQPKRIIIVWKYQSDSGQPLSRDHKSMNALEDVLEPAVEHDQFATLALVSTGENLREWTYYAESEDEFMARLNLALVGMPTFPIEIHLAIDPEWRMYEEFTGGVKGKVH